MKPPVERPKFPCALVVLILLALVLILVLIQSYGPGWSSILEPGREGGSGSPLEQVVESLRGMGRGLVDLFKSIIP